MGVTGNLLLFIYAVGDKLYQFIAFIIRPPK